MGDSALAIVFGEEIDEKINAKVLAVSRAVEKKSPPWLVEVVPTYSSLYVYYDPLKISVNAVIWEMRKFLNVEGTMERKSIIEIPVAYGGEVGPDIQFVAQHCGLSKEDVVKMHTSPLYRVYMLGFLPGFAYLGGLPEKLRTPRLERPRIRVPAGSVGIAGMQTGWYSIESPGGWRLIGRTPLRTFDPEKDVPSIVEPGDYVKFVPIPEEEFWKIHGEEW